MSHFQRTQYRVAGHYAHQGMYPGAPLRVHPVMPLMPYEAAASATSPYGATDAGDQDGSSSTKWWMIGAAVLAVAALASSRSPQMRTNPSAPGRTDTGPEDDIAQLPKAVEQETRLMQNVFKKV